jgi:hypothetical protein
VSHDIDAALRGWEYRAGGPQARLTKAADGRQVIQMRVDLGVLQMETTGRPDGARPHNFGTYFDHLRREARVAERAGRTFVLSEEQCQEADREFVQFYHRRISWLALRQYDRAIADADHTLAFMDFVKEHSADDEWTVSHEQYRPFVLFHRVQAAALAILEKHGPERAIGEINLGLEKFAALYQSYDAPEKFDDDEMVQRLEELQESLREHYKIGRTLDEQLADAVATEQYELAAQLRDEIAKRQFKAH